jgi:hypothetical protein
VLALTVEDSIAVALTAMKGEQCTSSLPLEFVAEGSDGGSRHNVFIIGRPLASSSASQLSSHSKPHFDVPFSWIQVNLCDENFTANTHNSRVSCTVVFRSHCSNYARNFLLSRKPFWNILQTRRYSLQRKVSVPVIVSLRAKL